MTKFELKHYESKTTKMVHMRGKFPEPRRALHTQCGQPLSNMTLLTRREVHRKPDYAFCRKCTQLLGLY